jgi:hypothetical protein
MIEHIAGIDVDGNIVVERVVLAKLKALKAVNDNLPGNRQAAEVPPVEEHAVPAQTCDMMGYRRG